MGRRKRKPEKEPNLERWLVSYGDFITLLFAVFVTLYSMGQTDKKKVEQLIISLHDSFSYSKPGSPARPTTLDSDDLRIIPSLRPETIFPGAGQGVQGAAKVRTHAGGSELRKIKAAIEADLVKNKAQDKVGVEINQRGLVVSLKEAGFFDSGSTVVRESSYPLLARVAASLAGYVNPIRVEGHTDNVPICKPPIYSNWELSTARATTIVHYLIERHRFDPTRLSAIGYGEYRPVAGNGSAEGRSKNRRVDIVLLSGKSEGGEPRVSSP